MKFKFPNLPRMWDFILASLALFAVIVYVAPEQVGVVLYKLALVSLGGVVGYWLDRRLFPYSRPHAVNGVMVTSAAMVRRAIIIGAVILGVTMGL
jgi:hypothetical protein